MDTELKEYLEAMEERLRTHTNAVEVRLKEHMELVETRLLRAFHDWARPHEIRARHAETVVRSFDERVALVEDRVAELERRSMT